MASNSEHKSNNFPKRRKLDAEKAPEKIAALLAHVSGLLEARQRVSENRQVDIDDIDILKYAKKLEKLEKDGQSATASAQLYKDLIKKNTERRDEAMKAFKLQNEAFKLQNMLRKKLFEKIGKELEKETLDERSVDHWQEKIESINMQINEIYMLDPIMIKFNEIKNQFHLIKEYFTNDYEEFKNRLLERDCIDVDGHRQYRCMVSGEVMNPKYLEAAHIIPVNVFDRVKTEAEKYLHKEEHGSMDVRNGLILCKPIHDFYNDEVFRIVFDEDSQRYQCIAFLGHQDVWELSSYGFALNDQKKLVKWITFRNDKKEQWPSPHLLEIRERPKIKAAVLVDGSYSESDDDENENDMIQGSENDSNWKVQEYLTSLQAQNGTDM
ncbi:hypothetical protein O9G_005515 [Rozella allomycis CSF55]|uniref:HNH nuclease domain-containing protein n=1 Tax=Rozella allomycis (strain CSF55) TaxID=988480 RepID=A0A075APC0_ROZAC|nr:hypothetical protein O9G_005515 [Rozella allomycis CSF55]|eukprot:EPZ31911.1 hypothetical protein O9G_005515 [Rozella allomycis CSF55]